MNYTAEQKRRVLEGVKSQEILRQTRKTNSLVIGDSVYIGGAKPLLLVRITNIRPYTLASLAYQASTSAEEPDWEGPAYLIDYK
jgi:hypothetical protein